MSSSIIQQLAFQANMINNMLFCLFLCALLLRARGLQFDLAPGEQTVIVYPVIVCGLFVSNCNLYLQCIGQELDNFETVVFATSASSTSKATKQKLQLTVRYFLISFYSRILIDSNCASDHRSR